MKEIILETNGLTKKYKDFTALDHANIKICRGDIYGLIGRNGAGKTTLMKLVTGLTEVTEGEYSLFSKTGKDIGSEKRRIGCLIENPAFFPNMSAYSNLKYFAIQKGITNLEQVDTALELVKLSDVKKKKFKEFSLGMKQRLGIAYALLDNPDLVILDEPINGLDPIGISELRDTFIRLNREKGITFIISSHILSELYLVANRFLFIEKGKILRELTHSELDAECIRCAVIRTDDVKHAAAIIEDKLGITEFKVIDSTEIRIYDDKIPKDKINHSLVTNDCAVSEIFETGITLEDYFKNLIGGAQYV